MSKTIEKELRKLLWLRHGCSISALYGDDGEMQCSACLLDFKRMSPEEMRHAWRRRNAARAISEAVGGTSEAIEALGKALDEAGATVTLHEVVIYSPKAKEEAATFPWRPSTTWRRSRDTKEGHAFLLKDFGKSLRDEKSLCGDVVVHETEHVIMETICKKCNELEREYR